MKKVKWTWLSQKGGLTNLNTKWLSSEGWKWVNRITKFFWASFLFLSDFTRQEKRGFNLSMLKFRTVTWKILVSPEPVEHQVDHFILEMVLNFIFFFLLHINQFHLLSRPGQFIQIQMVGLHVKIIQIMMAMLINQSKLKLQINPS